MRKQRLQYWIFSIDIAWIILALILAYVFRYGLRLYPSSGEVLPAFLPVVISSLPLWAVLFSRMKLDGFRLGWYFPTVVSQLLLATCLLLIVVSGVGYLARHYLSRLVLAYWGILLFFGFVAIRRLVHAVLRSRYLRGTMRRLVLVGSGPVAREMATKIDSHPEMLSQVVGYLYTSEASIESGIKSNSEVTTVQTLGVINLLQENRVDEIIITLSQPSTPEVMNLTTQCRKAGIGVSVVPHPYELYLSTPQLLDIGGLPLLKLQEREARFASGTYKRLLDILVTCIFVPLALPITLVAAIGLLSKKGGPFTTEVRCGLCGKPFRMYRLNSDRNSVTLPPFERLLQQSSITELPQFLNVLKGEMSLVGPRPEAPARVKYYSDWQRQRLNVRPGITGLAQVNGLREQHSSEEKARFDLQYMLHSSPFLDLSILLQTIWTLMVRLPGLDQSRPVRANSAHETANSGFQGHVSNAHSTQSSAD